MERAALIFGVILAIFFALYTMADRSTEGGLSFRIADFEGDAIYDAAAGVSAEQVFAEDSVRLADVAAIVQVIPEDRADIAVAIANPGGAPMPEVRIESHDVVIDGRLGGRIDDCLEDGGAVLDGYGSLPRERLPVIVVRTPRAVTLKADGAGIVEIGPAASVDAGISGCGALRVADVAGPLTMAASGSGDVTSAASGETHIRLAGSGAAHLGAVRERLSVALAGSGSVTAASLNGALEVRSAGSGETDVAAGAVTTADITVAGSGDVRIAAPVATLTSRLVGSGDVTVEGAVGSVDANIAGSGDVRVASLTGALNQNAMGSGRVVVEGR